MKRVLSIILTAMLMVTAAAVPSFAGTYENPDAMDISETAAVTQGTAEGLYEETDRGEVPSEYVKAESADQEESIVPNQSAAPNGVQNCGKNVTWELKDGVLTIKGTGAMADYSGDEYAPWYDICEEITEVVVENGVTAIGEDAFYDAYNLKKVTLADSVKKLGYGAFASCASLEEFTGNGLTEIDDYAFNLTSLSAFTVPSGIKTIGDTAFMGTPIEEYTVAAGNKTFTAKDGVLYTNGGKTLFMYPSGNVNAVFEIPSKVTKVAESAFLTNMYLKEITIPNSVTSLGASSFQQCEALKTVKIPDSVKEVGDYTFYECTSLETLKFGKGLKATSYLMFENCTALKNIDFGTGLEEIYSRTFSYCTELESVVVPANVKTINNGAFGECTGLKSVETKGVKDCISYQTFFGCGSLENVTLNEGIEYIYGLAFYGCDSLKEIYIPDSVIYIESEAFPETTVLKNLNSKLDKFGINGYRMVQNIYMNVQEKYSAAFNVLNIVNKERAKEGLSPLVMNKSLMDSAMLRAAECAVLFSHTRPDGTDCFSANDLMYGENIAYGAKSAKDVMNMWMNSSGHRANILTEGYTTIGIGCVVHDGAYYWVQCFGVGEDAEGCNKPADVTKEQLVTFTTDPIEDADNLVIKPRITVGNSNLNLKGKTTATVYVVDAKCKNKGITWSSSDEKVVTVTSAGKITAVGYGTATVTAKMKHYTLKKKINVVCPSHTYKTTTTKATPTADGKIVKKCTTCKKTITTKIYAPKTTKLSYTAATYSGKAKKPTVKVINSNGKVVSSKNYTVTYQKGRTKVGTYKVTVKFKNNYKGTVVKTFKIRPEGTALTAVNAKKAGMTVKWKKQATQTNGYEICYSTTANFKGGEKVQVTGNQKISKVINKLESGQKYWVKIRTYKNVNGTKYYSKWSAVKTVTTK